LLDERFDVCGVLLKKCDSPWINSRNHLIAKFLYNIECKFYRCRLLKVTESEELLAKSAGLNIIRVKSIKSNDAIALIKKSKPDIIVVGGGWHELIPPPVFNFPRLGCINTHPALLPAFRGTSITRWQILEGAELSGCTIHYVNEDFDAGNILMQRRLNVRPNISPQELFGDISILAADTMIELLRRFEKEGKLRGEDVSKVALQSKYYSKWTWNDEKLKIDWCQSLRDIERFVRANTQESYRYLGPWFRTNKGDFILRRAALMPSQNRATSSHPIVVEQSENIVWLEKHNDPHALGLVQVQRKDKFLKLRRGCQAESNIIITN
jgi:methionyl-tRNA formyltransferase